MAEFGIVNVDDDKLPRQPFYDMDMTVLRPDGSSTTVRTRTPFFPVEGQRITVRVKVRGNEPGWPERWREQITSYRVVGRPGLWIDEVEGSSDLPDVAIECEVKEEETR